MTTVDLNRPVLVPDIEVEPERAPASEPPRRERQYKPAVIVGLVILAVTLVHAWGMWTSPARVDDEGTYVAQAWTVETGRGLAHYTYWYDHPPLGWIQIAAVTGITGAFDWAPNAVAAGRVVMLLAMVISCWLLYLLSRRLALSRPAAIAAVALMAFNPLSMEFQRRVFLDNVATPWLLGAFVLALSPKRSLGATAFGGICFAIAVLSKETTLVLFPAYALALWQHGDPRNRKFTVAVATVVAALVIAIYPLYATLNGELLPGAHHVSLYDAVHWQLFDRTGSGSIWDAHSDVRGLLSNWFHFDAWLVGAATITAPIGLFMRRLRPIALAVAIQVLMLVRGGYIPFPYVIGVLPFAALLVAGLGDACWKWLPDAVARHSGRIGSIAARVALIVVLLVALVRIVPAWASGVSGQMTEDRDIGMTQAEHWIEKNVPKDSIVVVDDSLWLDLVRDGYPRKNVVWFYKLDLDPAVELKGGWQSIDYIALVSFQGNALNGLPTLTTAVDHSDVVARFGEGANQVAIYKVKK